jgi:hypothetical protein
MADRDVFGWKRADDGDVRQDVASAGRAFLKEFDAFWADPLHMKHPDAEAYSYLRKARDTFEATLRPVVNIHNRDGK